MTHPLLDGFKSFCAEAYRGGEAIMPRLVEDGQSPDYFVISCIDSRSNPGTIFKAAPGAFFAHKAMGAIVRPYKKGTALAAALQFALHHNKVKEIIVLGHTGCGAIESLVEKIDDDEIASFIDVAKEGLHKAEGRCANVCSHDEMLRYTEEEIVLLSAENLKSYPSVSAALAEGRATIRPWLFEMVHGDLLEYNTTTKTFTSIISDPNNKRVHHA
ncbi:MAG TPA: carbonic anhydrase [Alphaproteobacteria bacterium]|nr:carbonic anhydrase [Alphaproteobacteria bacterium]HNS44395.1 carbonic anhydrase [Alphaproteobacteria bacterium]